MESRWEKVQLGLHFLLFAAFVYLALLVGHLWTGGGELLGIRGLRTLGVLGATLLQLAARLFLLAAPGRQWALVALGCDLAGWGITLASPPHRGLAVVFHSTALAVALLQFRALAAHLDRPDLAVWVRRLGFLLLATIAGLLLAIPLPKPGLALAACAFGLAALRYLRLVNALATEVTKDLRLWRP